MARLLQVHGFFLENICTWQVCMLDRGLLKCIILTTATVGIVHCRNLEHLGSKRCSGKFGGLVMASTSSNSTCVPARASSN